MFVDYGMYRYLEHRMLATGAHYPLQDADFNYD